MRIRYDEASDTLSIFLAESGTQTKACCGKGVTVGYDSRGDVARVEIRNAKGRSGDRDVFRQILLEGIGPIPLDEPLIILPRLLDGIPENSAE